ncbi:MULTISPECIES: ABC transporter permease [Rhizobium]|uniref:ABC transporter permease subunit n=1 Tax=Rhizobium rhododendri TaxID=2506430 RepID=A0ABY8ISG4_9HYPH|nr:MULTISPECIES: ABC transporter permease subunit [Rhizobium]MBZ5759537.1 ABC transporter permease subunit [Rhizobium sp. VS19-DR96]MBZ5765730.1 ABC transporter permease subunit [Rhizobium sp. VS19-DR129.2]MBZ5773814.1 ABC transporter permease subunit [Rhizobium sp. VS19-DRK62.2]MBZ5784886.1 ABC transporter permease subunit [Rhizobium sp. VS19-DR121]MBZ5802037.1 ABC transporter permease subunit [Rhizobium sp. VS19-DR181]
MDIAFLSSTMATLLAALPMTLALFITSITLGGLLALGLVWMRTGGNPILSAFAKAYIFVFRGSPLLIQMFLIFYGLGQFGIIRYSFLWPLLREPFVCAVLSLALCTAGYTAEIFRGGIRAVSPKEIEAARSIGMSGFLLVRRILAPIAFRHALPAYSTEIVLMLKSTALASLVTVWEVTGVAQRLISHTYRTMEVFLCAAVIYLVLNFIILQAFGLLEYRLSRHRRAAPQALKA